MDKGGGGGLSLDTIGSFFGSQHPLDHNKTSTTIEFPISLNFRESFMTMAAGQLSPRDKQPVDEMDFFSEEKKASRATTEKPCQPVDLKVPNLGVKKEDFTVNTGLRLLTANTGSDESTVDDSASPNEEEKEGKSDQLTAIQAELGRMNEENQRLRGMLNQVTTNYNALQVHLVSLMQQREQRSGSPQTNHQDVDEKMDVNKQDHDGDRTIVPRQFMDLGPAATAETDEQTNSSTEDGSPPPSGSPPNNAEFASMDFRHRKSGSSEIVPLDHDKSGGGDGRGMIREDSPEGMSHGWIPNKLPKLTPTKNTSTVAAAAEQAQEATMRKARVSVRARSEAPMITDGCQWRKYGQKMAKGNPCPRAYYRCTMAAGCSVRKQVQRCAEDRSILITTYEGNHNHPLPPAAMAMASTTSAAASMLLSGSMSSADGMMNSNFLARTLLPSSSSMATISASAPFPTVTLDLTHTPSPLQFQRPPAAQCPIPFPNGSPSAFGSPPPPSPPLPQIFGQALYNQSKFSGLHSSSQETDAAAAAVTQFMQQRTSPLNPIQQQQQQASFADTVSAATAAITSDPNFTAAIAAAITSIIGAGSGAAHPANNTATTTATASNNSSNPSNSELPAS